MVSSIFERFNEIAAVYDAYRPSVPLVIVNILTQLAHVTRPQLVVDIGCGTGLSTRVWSEYADKVIGIDPNRRHAAPSG